MLDLGDGTSGILGVATKYHEWTKPETPKPQNRRRNLEVADRSGAFRRGVTEELTGRSGLALTWLEHLLVLSMLQHASGTWAWARYVVVHPVGNRDFVEACARYRTLLADEATFSPITLEDLLDARALPARTVDALGERYLPP